MNNLKLNIMVNLNEITEFAVTDLFYNERLEKKIASCIQQTLKIPRRITARGVIDLALLSDEERAKRVSRLKDLEILDAFLSHNSIFLEDREEIEKYSTLDEGIAAVYSERTHFQRIKKFVEQERRTLKSMAKQAEELRKKYIKNSKNREVEKEILTALSIAPLGSDIMWVIIYDLCQNITKIGTLGNTVSKVALDSLKSCKGEVCYNQTDHPSQKVAGYF